MAYMPNVIAAAMPRQAENTEFFSIATGTKAPVCPWRPRKHAAEMTAIPKAARLWLDSHPQCGPSMTASDSAPRAAIANACPVTSSVRPFRHRCCGQHQCQHAHRNDQQENAAPADRIDHYAAERRPDDEGEAVTARPHAQSARALFGVRISDRENRK